ncbi:MAG: ATP-binding protein [Tateyamaria sp.]|nr:ATP-binding protein [Tateyamaria sp.]
MIISFEVENCRSIYERQEISFVASNLKDCEGGIIETDAFSEGRLLPAILFYGPNASGKSNLITAISAMIETILFSQTKGQPGGRIPTRRPFLLDPAAKDSPTIFEIDFIMNGVRFNYGFALTETEVSEEWLFSYPHGTPRKLFERLGQEFSFGRNLKGRNSTIADLTRRNSLFVSAAAQSGHEQLSEIFNFFDSIQIETSLSMSGSAAERRIKDEHNWHIDEEVIEYLKEINSGVLGYRTKEREVSEEERSISKKIGLAVKSIFEEVDADFELRTSNDVEKVIELEHQGIGDFRTHFPIQMESAGTLRLLSALPKVLGVLKTGGVIIVDELDLSLHTHAAEKLLQMFCSKALNPRGAQILTTTHDTNLMEIDCLRRDQVWFVSKDRAGSTEIYPLTDIRTRSSDNIERGYLQGRFGATPI